VSSSDWYARKLGGARRPTGYQANLPPTGPPQQFTQPQTYQPQHPQPVPYGQEYQPVTSQRPDNATWQAMSSEDKAAAMVRHPEWWSDKQATVKAGEVFRCPSCGSNDFFTRQKMGSAMGQAPAPHCFSCGYNGMYEQFGSQDAH
jgi:hypothetical protein